MIHKLQFILLFVLLNCSAVISMAQTPASTVMIETSMGNMKCHLYEETPMHTENFLRLAGEGYYDGLLFHRVINNFMIQTGDPNSRDARKGEALGYGGPEYTIPAEFHPGLYHRKGVLASARQPDQVNPAKESNGSQFYIVQGQRFTDQQMDAMEADRSHIKFTEEQRKVYKSSGGSPHLDYSYTVFGEVVEGLEVIDKIAALPCDPRNRPLEDVKIIRIRVMD